jgi:hypothetical protein
LQTKASWFSPLVYSFFVTEGWGSHGTPPKTGKHLLLWIKQSLPPPIPINPWAV